MATIETIKKNGKFIYPLTSTKAIVDEEGKRVNIPTKTSELENDSEYATMGEVESLLTAKPSSNLTSIVSISEEEYNSKLADGTLSSTTMYVIV